MSISSIGSFASQAYPASPAQTVQPPTQDQKALLQAVKTVNAAGLVGEDNEITFIVNRALNIAVVRIINTKTGDVVQQIPNEQVLKMAEEATGR